jgi:predicted Ser/Thr protein kinase
MPLLTKCTFCQTPAKVPDNAVGKKVKCPNPKCAKEYVVAAAPALVGAAAGSSHPGAKSSSGSVDVGASIDFSAPPAAGGNATECPACKSPLLPGAIACMDCGFALVQEQPAAQTSEGPVNICANPACGVANPAGERNCQRCSSPLPMPGGTMIGGRFRIEKQLAVGGFGAVYLATDTKGNVPVAIKEMLCEDPQEFNIRLNFFRREAEILRSLEKVPIVPRVFEFIQVEKQAYLVLEFIRGKDLLKIMEANNNKPFTLPQVIEWAKSVCDVLAHMHSQSPPLIHRDLKPDNVMLLEDQRSIKMIDFGTARDLGRTQRTRMQAKTRVYTEGYAPPEQIIGKPEARSDLFALAGTLYHLVTGKAPEGYYTSQEIDQQLKDPKCTIPADQRWFFELLKINLAEDINERYFSAKEIKRDLERKQVSKEVQCPKCKVNNKVREPYCAKCGEGLTEQGAPCSHCGKSCRMGSRCCIYCGNRLR